MQFLLVYALNFHIWEISTNIPTPAGKTQENSPTQLGKKKKKSTINLPCPRAEFHEAQERKFKRLKNWFLSNISCKSD